MKIKVSANLEINKLDISVWSDSGCLMPYGGEHTIELDVTESLVELLNKDRVDAIDNGRVTPVTWDRIFRKKEPTNE
jgi:hypothetical protein